jgi:hypothetical protein
MKLIKQTGIILFISIMAISCDPTYIPPSTPSCNWVTNQTFWFDKVNLNIPNSNEYIGLNVQSFISFGEVFTAWQSPILSKIKISTKADGCDGTTSMTKEYINSNDAEMSNTKFTQQWSVGAIEQSGHTITIEVTSGSWKKKDGNSGTLVWTKKLDGMPFGNQGNFEGDGVFVPSNPNYVYANNSFKLKKQN